MRLCIVLGFWAFGFFGFLIFWCFWYFSFVFWVLGFAQRTNQDKLCIGTTSRLTVDVRQFGPLRMLF